MTLGEEAKKVFKTKAKLKSGKIGVYKDNAYQKLDYWDFADEILETEKDRKLSEEAEPIYFEEYNILCVVFA